MHLCMYSKHMSKLIEQLKCSSRLSGCVPEVSGYTSGEPCGWPTTETTWEGEETSGSHTSAHSCVTDCVSLQLSQALNCLHSSLPARMLSILDYPSGVYVYMYVQE